MYAYSVWPFRLRFIITSYNWMELVGKLKSDADKEWLRANSVYHYCADPPTSRPELLADGGALLALAAGLRVR